MYSRKGYKISRHPRNHSCNLCSIECPSLMRGRVTVWINHDRWVIRYGGSVMSREYTSRKYAPASFIRYSHTYMQVISFNDFLPSNIPVDCILVITDCITCSSEIRRLLSPRHQGAKYKYNDWLINGTAVTHTRHGKSVGQSMTMEATQGSRCLLSLTRVRTFV